MPESLFDSIYAINPNSPVAIYRQVMEQTKQAITLGVLKPGDLLPSVRTLSAALQVNPMTISKAFSNLESESVLVRKKGIGMIVNQQQTAEFDNALVTQLTAFITNAQAQGLDQAAILALVQRQLANH